MVSIYCQDALELLRDLPDKSVDLILTDPPYGIGIAKTGHVGNGKKGFTKKSWDSRPPDPDVFRQILRVSRWSIIWGAQYFADRLPPSGKWLIWDKAPHQRGKTSFADCELAWCSWKGPARIHTRIWRGFSKQTRDERLAHPTQKPSELMEWCIGQCPTRPSSILDPFMGTGSVLVAAERLGIDVTGSDLDPEYVQMVRTRLKVTID